MLRDGGLGPGSHAGHAVAPAVVALVGPGEEEQEYAVTCAAALDAVALLAEDDPPRRLVAVLEVPDDRIDPGDASAVEVTGAVPLSRLVAVLADDASAEPDVAAARAALTAGAPDADEALDRTLDHELGWWAAQELEVLLAELA